MVGPPADAMRLLPVDPAKCVNGRESLRQRVTGILRVWKLRPWGGETRLLLLAGVMFHCPPALLVAVGDRDLVNEVPGAAADVRHPDIL